MKNLKKLLFLPLLLVCYWAFAGEPAAHIVVKGRVVDNHGVAVANVPVTDGVSVVLTDSKGRYVLQSSSLSDMVYYTLPSGYASEVIKTMPNFYRNIDKSKPVQHIDFTIYKSENSADKHAFAVWADPQVLRTEELPLLAEIVDDLAKTKAEITTPFHAISVGDNVFDRSELIEPYQQVISKLGFPFYHVVGNHDMDYNGRSNEGATDTYKKNFGPTHYSFNVGKIHYVVLNNVFYYGNSYRYIGYITEQQLSWLEQDLSHVPHGSTVVVSMHIPAQYGDSESPSSYASLMSNSTMNNKALYAIMKPYNTHIMTGHSHIQWNTQLADNILEHTHAAASGAWWQGEVGLDGSPKGYTVYEVDGDKISWYFKGLNCPKEEQLKLYASGSEIIANVFNYDSQWSVEWYENGVLMGEMKQFWGVDPLAKKLYPAGGNKIHSWLSYGKTNHLFKATLKDAKADVKVVVTDRFGKKYTKELAGYTLVWSDEFDGASLNNANWTAEIGTGHSGWGNQELQYYTDRSKNVDVKDGSLRITAVKEKYQGSPVTSARLITLDKFFFKYGYVVASIKFPSTADGLWPAFWMMGNDFKQVGWPACGETDIIEMGHSTGMANATQDRYFNGACHWGSSHANHVTYDYSLQDGQFHTYTCIWDENQITMYVDLEKYPNAEPYFVLDITDKAKGKPGAHFHKDNFILLNLAVGGMFPGISDINKVTALKDGSAAMEVDYVRVYQRK